MHAKDDIRLIKVYDGLVFSFQVLSLNYQNLHNSCILIPNENEKLVLSFSKCWSIIDTTHRIREIAQSIPGLSKKNKILKNFLKSTSLAKEFRHYIQHLRRELSNNPPNNYPVFGSLSWIDKNDNSKCHTIILGSQIGKQNYFSCIYDRINDKWLSNVCLSINNSTFNFDPIFDEVMKFKKFILDWIEKTYNKDINKIKRYPIFTT